jgi:hypothetical protein
MAGGDIGWFVGDYVYGKRDNPALDKKPAITHEILDHFRIGGAYPPVQQINGSIVCFSGARYPASEARIAVGFETPD